MVGFKWRYTVTLECDSRNSPDCHRSLERESPAGPLDAQEQVVATARRAGWSPRQGDWRDGAVCPACLTLEPEATAERTVTVRVCSGPPPGAAGPAPTSEDSAVRRLLDGIDAGD